MNVSRYVARMPTTHIGSIDMFYEEHGSGDPLLLVMGFATDSTAWLLQVPEFAKRYRTIVFDNRGVGRSSKPAGPYTIHEMADEAVGLLDHLGIERTHVLGLSMGGMIAQELTLRHPERVRKLVLAATYPEPDADVERTRLFMLGQMGGSISTDGALQIDLKAIDPLLLFQHLLPLVFNPEFINTQLPRLMQLFGGALQYGFSMEAIVGQMDALVGHKATDRLHGITAPTLVLTGDADRLIPPANSDVLAKYIPGATLVKIPGGSHGFNIEQPELFNRTVLQFLASDR